MKYLLLYRKNYPNFLSNFGYFLYLKTKLPFIITFLLKKNYSFLCFLLLSGVYGLLNENWMLGDTSHLTFKTTSCILVFLNISFSYQISMLGSIKKRVGVSRKYFLILFPAWLSSLMTQDRSTFWGCNFQNKESEITILKFCEAFILKILVNHWYQRQKTVKIVFLLKMGANQKRKHNYLLTRFILEVCAI